MATPTNNSIVKAFAILDLFDDRREELNAADVAALLGLNAITAHRFLKTLAGVGALYSPRKGAYRPGGKLVEYGERAKSFRQMAVQLQPFLNHLAAGSGEGAMATAFDGAMITCIAAAHSDNAFVFNARVGARMEAHATANGKLWLAFGGKPALDSFLAVKELVPLSKATLVDRDALVGELETIRRSGFATNHGEREAELSAVAVPLFAPGGTMTAGISIFAPSHRLERFSEDRILALLRETIARAQATLYPASPQ